MNASHPEIKRNTIRHVPLVFLLLAGCALCAYAFFSYRTPSRRLTYSATTGIVRPLPSFSLTDQHRRVITESAFEGKIWIADLIFTRCDVSCPLMTGLMARAQDRLSENANVRFASFSVDPSFDTPERLNEYAERFGADPERWYFLTGDRPVVEDLARNFFRLASGNATAEERRLGASDILHSDRFVLIDQRGRIAGYYRASDPSVIDHMVRDVHQLTHT